MSYYPNYILESILFFTSIFYGLYLILKNKSDSLGQSTSPLFFFNYSLLNLYFFFLYFSSSTISYVHYPGESVFGFFNLNTFLGFSFFNILVFFIFLRSTKFKSYLSNIQFLGSVYFFLFFSFFICVSFNSLDSLVLLEFCTISVLLYVVSSTTATGVSGGASLINRGVNVRFSSISFLVVSFLNFFFLCLSSALCFLCFLCFLFSTFFVFLSMSLWEL